MRKNPHHPSFLLPVFDTFYNKMYNCSVKFVPLFPPNYNSTLFFISCCLFSIFDISTFASMNQDFRMLVDIFRGTRNVFGYSRTLINQMHFMNWLVGEFYYSNVFSRPLRVFWGFFNIINGLIMVSHCVLYMIFTSNLNFYKILNVCEVILSAFYFLFFFPLVSYIYRNHTSEALKILDRMNEEELNQSPILSDITFVQRPKYGSNIFLKVIGVQIGMGTCFYASCYLDLFIGFTPDKLRNPDYYPFPSYSEWVDRLSAFWILSISQFVSSVPLIMNAILVPCFSLVTVREFYHRFQSISDSLDHHSKLLTFRYEQMLRDKRRTETETIEYQKLFSDYMGLFSKCHRELLRGIDHFKKYLQFNMSTSVVLFLYNEILLVYMVFLNESTLARIKVLSMAAGICTVLYSNCLIGRLFTDMSEMFNESVYNTPWYYLSPSGRKSMYLLLHQSQTKIQLKAIMIYPMDMTFFLRLCNYVYSIVNVLRRYYYTRYTS